MKHDQLADMFSTIKNAEAIGRKQCVVPNSRLIRDALRVMHENKYIGKTEVIEDGRGGKIKIEMLGRINDCGIIKPNFSVKMDEFIKYEKRYLPARDVGILIVTTSKGVMDQHSALKKRTGGRLLGFVF